MEHSPADYRYFRRMNSGLVECGLQVAGNITPPPIFDVVKTSQMNLEQMDPQHLQKNIEIVTFPTSVLRCAQQKSNKLYYTHYNVL